MAARPRCRRLRVLRPQRAREPRRRLRDVSWPRRSDAAHAAREHAANGVVPAVPSPSRALRAADERGLQHAVGTAVRWRRARPAAGAGAQDREHDELLDLSPVSTARIRRPAATRGPSMRDDEQTTSGTPAATVTFRTPASRVWRSLEELQGEVAPPAPPPAPLADGFSRRSF